MGMYQDEISDTLERIEAQILKTNALLITFSKLEDETLAKNFCGDILPINNFYSCQANVCNKTVYLSGDLSKVGDLKLQLEMAKRVFIIRELSQNYNESDNNSWSVIGVGRVPILLHGVGVYYRRFFDFDLDYFNRILAEHTFQYLTESTKPNKAHRTGIYLTPVEEKGEDIHFRLLRCSSNLSGPTENFRATDRHIVDALNRETAYIFQNHAPLNHVLAQIYHNTPATNEQKQTKAKIKDHSDKTKDMPKNGLIAFCTFYNQLDKLQPMDEYGFDYGYKGNSGMTKLCFHLKKTVAEQPGCTLPAQFTVTLYPNSLFIIPLSTNRLYRHEIRSSTLEATKLPTRMGYVVRCSDTEAVHKNGHTFLKKHGELIHLELPTPEGMAELRKQYAEENKIDDFIDYGGKFLFSMNQGDYIAPDYRMADEFRQYTLPIKGNLFDEMLASVQFEQINKGRQGALLVKPHEARGTPLVRTTTKYKTPAYCFQSAHVRLAQQIQNYASIFTDFNNALIENYTNLYTTMGFHSDQALDLEEESFIAVFSCYKYPELATSPRKLIVESKEPRIGTFEIPLTHNSVVVFSLDTNRRFKHKIVLDKVHSLENPWLGITFRTSKTFVRFHDEQAYFEDGTLLTLANEDQNREFYALRSQENKETNFSYPQITYTISESDMMPPIPFREK